MHNQAQKFASIAGGVEDRKKLGGTPSWGVESRYELWNRCVDWTHQANCLFTASIRVFLKCSATYKGFFYNNEGNSLQIDGRVSYLYLL